MSKAMSYETTPFKVGSSPKAIKNKAGDNTLDRVSTSQIVWHLVKRHKFGLVSTYAIILTAVWVFPPLPYLVMAIFGR